jgi:hypothetical protein
MTKRESGAISHRNTFLGALRVFGGLLIFSLAGAMLATWLVNRYVVFSIEEGKGQRSILIRTPLGSFPSGPSKARSSLWPVVYPKSEWDEQNDTDFYEGTAGNEHKSAQLTVLRFRVRLSLAQIDEWYRHRLGEDFVRSKGWSIKPNDANEQEWLRQVHSDPDAEALAYQQQMAGRVRGALLEALPDGDILATLYDFQEDNKR